MFRYHVVVVDKDGKRHEFFDVIEYFHQEGELRLVTADQVVKVFSPKEIHESEIKRVVKVPGLQSLNEG